MSRRRSLRGVGSVGVSWGVVLALIVGLSAEEAVACSCSMPGVDLPAHESTGVPTNVRVWVSANQATGLLGLKEVDGDAVTTTSGSFAIGGAGVSQRWLAPTAPLKPRTTYEVFTVSGEIEAFPVQVSRFTTGDGPDTTPPAVPSESGREVFVFEGNLFNGWSSCGDSYAVGVSFAPEADRAFLVGRRGGVSAGEPPDVSSLSYSGLPDLVHLGSGGCASSWPNARRGSSTPVAFAAYDLAGNFSGWTEVTTVVIDGDGFVGGCTSVGGPWVALALLALRRRRSVPIT